MKPRFITASIGFKTKNKANKLFFIQKITDHKHKHKNIRHWQKIAYKDNLVRVKIYIAMNSDMCIKLQFKTTILAN